MSECIQTCAGCGAAVFHVRPVSRRGERRADIVLEHLRQAVDATAEELRARSGFHAVGDSLHYLLKAGKITKHPPRDGERYPHYSVATDR